MGHGVRKAVGSRPSARVGVRAERSGIARYGVLSVIIGAAHLSRGRPPDSWTVRPRLVNIC